MLKRKAEILIRQHLLSDPDSMLVVDGARQVGKSFLIRMIGQELFDNYIEVNMELDKQSDRLFANALSVNDFYMALSVNHGHLMDKRENTLVFIDEIQAYSHLLTLAKFLVQDRRFTFIASGSLLGVALKKTQSIPLGSIRQLHMYPMDFEEFLWANNVGQSFITGLKSSFLNNSPIEPAFKAKTLDLFKRYLLVGGMPQAVASYIENHNITLVRNIHRDIVDLYSIDAAKYEEEASKKLKISRIYSMIPSNMENVKKRLVVKDIDGRSHPTSYYQDDFDYLVASGIALEVDAISKPSYPLIQNSGKNLLKLYMNDVGLLSSILYGNRIQPVLDDIRSINLGAVYETVVAQELKAHGFNLYYYDNKKKGEVDFLVDNTDALASLPIEVKSGRDYNIHSAIDTMVNTTEYGIPFGYVFSNSLDSIQKDKIRYSPIYNIMFIHSDDPTSTPDTTF